MFVAPLLRDTRTPAGVQCAGLLPAFTIDLGHLRALAIDCYKHSILTGLALHAWRLNEKRSQNSTESLYRRPARRSLHLQSSLQNRCSRKYSRCESLEWDSASENHSRTCRLRYKRLPWRPMLCPIRYRRGCRRDKRKRPNRRLTQVWSETRRSPPGRRACAAGMRP